MDAADLLPKVVGDFRSQGARPVAKPLKLTPEDYGIVQAAEGTYVSKRGERLAVTVVRTETQAGAYALLSEVAAQLRAGAGSESVRQGGVGLAGVEAPGRQAFYKGRTFVSITGKASTGSEGGAAEFARAFAETVEEGENEIPFLVRHLPDWEKAQERAVYAVTLPALRRAAGRHPVLEVVDFEKGTEAITATYDSGRLVIVEYATPQIAASADQLITDRIGQLRESGQAVPSSYRRVGNYAVFAFDARDEAAATQLIDQVKYEQKIQWLGENPFLWAAYQEATTQNTQKAVSLIVAIFKGIGLLLVVCVGAGGIVGGIFFLRRRAQQRAEEAAGAYSDAGGMLRLNLDELSPQTDPAKLLGSGGGDGKAAIQ